MRRDLLDKCLGILNPAYSKRSVDNRFIYVDDALNQVVMRQKKVSNQNGPR